MAKKELTRADLLGMLEGTGFSEKIVNVYYAILERMNLVQLSIDNHQRTLSMLETPDGRASLSSHHLLAKNTMKILYLDT